MRRILYLIIYIAASVLLTACSSTPSLPTQYSEVAKSATIYPNYTDVTVPANIAPLNFQLKDNDATDVVVELKGEKGEPVLVAGGDECVVQIDTTEWRALLNANRGGHIQVSVYAEHADGWVLYKPHRIDVAAEDIDPYLSYRLIEPGFELYRQLGLYQRNLTNWDVHTIYENNRVYSEDDNHCINCHNYQGYSTQKMLFHVRAKHGGTIVVNGDKAEKVQIKDSTIISAGVYPSWHPKHNWVAFSTNKTGQTFHIYSDEKIEVVDEASDLLFYDVDKNEVQHILRTADYLETFPCWAPDGKTLYYCSAYEPSLVGVPDSLLAPALLDHYQKVHYNLMSMSFDESTKQFGEAKMVMNCDTLQKSCSVPRVSPDGRYILFTLGDYGQFHIWHKSSDLWVKDLQADTCYPLAEANSPDVDSYHSWSSNGRWIVFSSRRMDGNYTRPFIAYFDKNGKAHKAFCLPQEDPRQNVLLLKSYNVPELTKDAVRVSEQTLHDCIYNTEGTVSKYVRTPRSQQTGTHVDAATSASGRVPDPTGAASAQSRDAASSSVDGPRAADASTSATARP